MATITGTTATYGVGSAGGNREDLEDKIWDLFPDDTYVISNIDKVKASATYHEWLADSLVAAGSNINLEGNDGAFSSIVSPARYGNYTQIFKKEFLVSGTQEVVSKAGRRTETARQLVKQMRELKNDVEYAVVRNQAATAGSYTVGRSLGSIESWIGATSPSATAATQIVLATVAADGHVTAELASGAPGVAPTDAPAGSTGAFTVASLRLALQAAWEDGGSTDIILANAAVKNAINDFSGIAQRQVDVGRGAQASITGAADLYVSNYGTHKIVLHRHARSNVCLCLDTSMWALATLRGFQMQKLAKTGDAEKSSLLFEGTLVARNWEANSKVVGIT
jgi:hypothetical protein